ncbi:hypothetical protein RIF29_19942 [Crotalaria pallida]|uniref:Uncharacterized protein n=1 Tax=Crotalaria pallida TaxID=3830 RepID=A0AAN9F2K4_CROPI
MDSMELKNCLSSVLLLTVAMLTTALGAFVGVNIGTDVLSLKQITQQHLDWKRRNKAALLRRQRATIASGDSEVATASGDSKAVSGVKDRGRGTSSDGRDRERDN